jgi:aminoglycoside phosphotransferase (APT) family kinase protein
MQIMRLAQPGPLLAAGRSADVYLVGADRVLRRYRESCAADFDAEREARLMAYVLEQGFAVPRVYDANRTDILMDRVEGSSMLATIARQPWTLSSQARTLADLHSRLHDIRGPGWLSSPFGEGNVLLHLDLHPDNVLITDKAAVVIDWQNSARGPAGADLAKTWIILATAAVPGRGAKPALMRAARRHFLKCFLRQADTEAARSSLAAVAGAWITNPRTSDKERAATDRLLRDAAGR